MTGYSRAKFGPAWEDVDLNRCDTRNDILARDLRQVVYKTGSSCIVAKGELRDPYTATMINFVRGLSTSSKVQIDLRGPGASDDEEESAPVMIVPR